MGTYASDQKNARFYGLKLSRNTDADLINWLDGQESVQGYLKELIRDDMRKGEHTMNTWYIVDDATTTAGLLDAEPIHTTDKQAALIKALRGWNHLTQSEQKNRDDFYIAFGKADDDGLLDWNTVKETVSFKARYHVKPEFFSLWGEEVDEETVIDLAEVVNLSLEWGKPVDELLEQLEEI